MPKGRRAFLGTSVVATVILVLLISHLHPPSLFKHPWINSNAAQKMEKSVLS